MTSRTSPKTVFIVPAMAWLVMAFAACWLIVQRHQFGPRFPRLYDLVGRPVAWEDTTPGALVTPIAIGACGVAIVAIANWIVRRPTRPRSPPLVQRSLTITEVVVAVLATETALLPLIGVRPLLLTACFGLFFAVVALAHADLTDEARRREARREEGRTGMATNQRGHWHGAVVYVHRDDDAVRVRRSAGFAHALSFDRPVTWVVIGVVVLFFVVVASVESVGP